MTPRSFAALILLLSMLTPATRADNRRVGAVEGMLSTDMKQRSITYSGILEEQSKLVQELIAVVKRQDLPTTYDSPMHLAVQLLGQLRAKDAVFALSDRLMYLPLYPTGGWSTYAGRPAEAYYVCAAALVEIGEPSVSPMLRKIRRSNDEAERNEAAWVIMSVEGKDQALHRLDRLIEKDDRHKDRYQEARSFIANYKPDYRHPLKRAQEEQKAVRKSVRPPALGVEETETAKVGTPLPSDQKVVLELSSVANEADRRLYGSPGRAADPEDVDESDLEAAKKASEFWIHEVLKPEWIPGNLRDLMTVVVGKPAAPLSSRPSRRSDDEYDAIWTRYSLGGYAFQIAQSSGRIAVAVRLLRPVGDRYPTRYEEEQMLDRFMTHSAIRIHLTDWEGTGGWQPGGWRHLARSSLNDVLEHLDMEGKAHVGPYWHMWWGRLVWRSQRGGGLLFHTFKAAPQGPLSPVTDIPDWFRREKFTRMGRDHLLNPAKREPPKR